MNEGPWFWGNVGLFMTSWFLEFDPNTMVVSKMLVWVKLYNERLSKDIYTFARICVEVDLSQGLLGHIFLLHNEKQWAQPLDYENTAFRCRICRQTGHLQSACP